MMTNAKAVDMKLREVFKVESEFTDLDLDDPKSWIHHVHSINDMSDQVVEIKGTFPSEEIGQRAGRAALNLAGEHLPKLLGIQVSQLNGQILARIKRTEIMHLNQPLGKNRPAGW